MAVSRALVASSSKTNRGFFRTIRAIATCQIDVRIAIIVKRSTSPAAFLHHWAEDPFLRPGSKVQTGLSYPSPNSNDLCLIFLRQSFNEVMYVGRSCCFNDFIRDRPFLSITYVHLYVYKGTESLGGHSLTSIVSLKSTVSCGTTPIIILTERCLKSAMLFPPLQSWRKASS